MVIKIIITIFIISLFANTCLAATKANSLTNQKYSDIERKDHKRDNETKAKQLSRNMKVYRYAERKKDLLKDVKPKEHMTSHVDRGRPISGATAKNRYGLSYKPRYRETVNVEKGTMAKKTKVVGGDPGRGELTVTEKIRKTMTSNLTKLPN